MQKNSMLKNIKSDMTFALMLTFFKHIVWYGEQDRWPGHTCVLIWPTISACKRINKKNTLALETCVPY